MQKTVIVARRSCHLPMQKTEFVIVAEEDQKSCHWQMQQMQKTEFVVVEKSCHWQMQQMQKTEFLALVVVEEEAEVVDAFATVAAEEPVES